MFDLCDPICYLGDFERKHLQTSLPTLAAHSHCIPLKGDLGIILVEPEYNNNIEWFMLLLGGFEAENLVSQTKTTFKWVKREQEVQTCSCNFRSSIWPVVVVTFQGSKV